LRVDAKWGTFTVQKRSKNATVGVMQIVLFLKYSFYDRLLAETVNTVEAERIVSEVLARAYTFVSEAVFQSQVLNHVYGEVLVGAIQ
jgi:hypothetical protein